MAGDEVNDFDIIEQLGGDHKEVMVIALGLPGHVAQMMQLSECTGLDYDTLDLVVEELRGYGLAERAVSAAGEVTLNARGRRVAERVRTSRLSGQERADAVQDALLRWIASGPSEVHLTDFVGHTEATAWGIEFTDREIQDAAGELDDAGLVTTLGTTQARILRAKITSAGRRAIRSGMSLAEYLRRPRGGAQVNHVTNSNNVVHVGRDNIGQIQAGGSENTMEVTQQISTGTADQIVKEIDKYLDKHSDDTEPAAAEFNGSLVEVRDEVGRGDASKSWLDTKVGELLRSALAVAPAAVELVQTLSQLNA